MVRCITLIAVLMLLCSANAYSTGKALAGNLEVRIGTGNEWWYYYDKGSNIPDSGSYLVAIVNLQKQTINIAARDIALRDSLYRKFIPGNTFIVWLSGDLKWSEQEELYTYSYELHSDSSSTTSVDLLRLEKFLNCREMLGPPGWVASDFGEIYDWSNVRESQILKPGGEISGYGFKTSCPPRLGIFGIFGETIDLGGAGWDEVTWTDASGIANDNRSVSGITIIPGPCPEVIEPVDWVDKIMYSLWKLVANGYMNQATEKAVHIILNDLKGAMLHKSEHSIELLEEHVNMALDELAEYEEDMEPEAWGYIVENLNYMLRHTDIIVFKRSMWK